MYSIFCSERIFCRNACKYCVTRASGDFQLDVDFRIGGSMQNGAGERTEKLDMERVFVCGKPGFYMNVVGYKESIVTVYV